MNRYQSIRDQFYGNRLLFGDPAERGIVAAEIASVSEIELFKRIDGELIRERKPLRLFALLADPELLKGFKGQHRLTQLEGDFHFRWLAEFGRTDALETAKRHLRKVTGKAAGAGNASYLVLTDPIQQHLILSGATFFLGVEFEELRRLQLDLETYTTPPFEFPSAARDGDRIIAIAITGSSGLEQVLPGTAMDERAMLTEFVRIVNQLDPDIIVGHNLFRFDLEYLEERARRHKVELKLGRDGSRLHARSSRLQIAERSIAYRRYDIYGRSIVDTWILAQHYDIASRELEGFGLKELAQHFHLDTRDRTYIDPARVSVCFDREPDTLMRYALDDARETGALAELLCPSYFVQAQIFPYSFQNVMLRGNATKIDSLMIRAYLAAHHSVPVPGDPAEIAGGHTEMRRCGVARRVLHCDVTSLYPSLMLQYGHRPAADQLGVFLKLLNDLRDFRVQAKALMRELDGAARRHIEALQQTFKILINSFYGYLGFALGHFNDFKQANAVTARGRDLIKRAVADLEALGAQVIEIDTDGIYFVAPPGVDDESAADALIEKLAASMPEGIRLEIDGRYAAMFSYKMKNYVLMDESGEVTIRGGALKSRGLERFQRRFMEDLFTLLLEERRAEIPALAESYRARITRHELPIGDLMKTETLQDSLDLYRAKIGSKRRNASAAYELALKSERPYQSGDQISYYITGRSAKVKVNAAAKMAAEYDPALPDENIEYYQAKLAELYEKFRPYVERAGLFAASELEPPPEPASLFAPAADPAES